MCYEYLQIPGQASVFYGPFHAAFGLTMENAVLWIGRAETLAVPKQVNGLQKIGFSLAVPSGKKIGICGGNNLQFADIPVIEETQSCELHS